MRAAVYAQFSKNQPQLWDRSRRIWTELPHRQAHTDLSWANLFRCTGRKVTWHRS